MGTLWSLCSRSTCLWEWKVCDWCWAGSLPLWIILSCRGTDLKGTKAYGVTGCNSAVKVTDSFLEKDGVPRFYFLFVGRCVRKPLWESFAWAVTWRKGKGLLKRWRDTVAAEGTFEGRKLWQVKGNEIKSVWLECGDSERPGGPGRGQTGQGLVDVIAIWMLFKRLNGWGDGC